MNFKNKIISLAATGQDSPGLVSRITSKILELNGNIIDVEENCRRGLFYIFLIIDFSMSDCNEDKILKTLKTIEKETCLKVIVDIHDKDHVSDLYEHKNHLVTIFGIDQPGIIAKVSTFFYKKNINIVRCRTIARGKFFSMEMIIDTGGMKSESSSTAKESFEKMKINLKKLCSSINQSVVIQNENIYKQAKKLVVFDLESSLIQGNSINKFFNKIKGRIKTVNGNTDFNKKDDDQMLTLINNASFLKGIPVSDFEKFSNILQLNPSTCELIRILKTMGFKIAIISTGFNFFIKKIFEKAGIDYAFSNSLKVDKNGLTTGELEDPVIINTTKKDILDFIMKSENIKKDQVIAIGDGSNRSHFIKNVGLSIAFKPDHIKTSTDGILASDNIINILYCLGIPKSELNKFINNK